MSLGHVNRHVTKDRRFYDLKNTEPIRMEGWLEKRGKYFGWKSRYFVLCGRVLHQFKVSLSPTEVLCMQRADDVNVSALR